jgi:hypothetical protein
VVQVYVLSAVLLPFCSLAGNSLYYIAAILRHDWERGWYVVVETRGSGFVVHGLTPTHLPLWSARCVGELVVSWTWRELNIWHAYSAAKYNLGRTRPSLLIPLHGVLPWPGVTICRILWPGTDTEPLRKSSLPSLLIPLRLIRPRTRRLLKFRPATAPRRASRLH